MQRKTRSRVGPYLTDLLKDIKDGKSILRLQKNATVFAQGDAADSIYFIETGQVKITVLSAAGRVAVLAVLGPRGFLGEGCLVGQTLRVSTAKATELSTLFCIEKGAMLRALLANPELSERFTASVLARNIDIEQELCNQVFNHSEKRLARVLLKLARFTNPDTSPAAALPKISHEALAKMVGATPTRIKHLMSKFERLGLIDINGEIIVRAELLTDVVLHD